MNSLAFAHRYGLALEDGRETAAELHRELVDAGHRAASAEERIGQMETRHYRLLSAGERLLRGELTMEQFADAVKGARK